MTICRTLSASSCSTSSPSTSSWRISGASPSAVSGGPGQSARMRCRSGALRRQPSFQVAYAIFARRRSNQPDFSVGPRGTLCSSGTQRCRVGKERGMHATVWLPKPQRSTGWTRWARRSHPFQVQTKQAHPRPRLPRPASNPAPWGRCSPQAWDGWNWLAC